MRAVLRRARAAGSGEMSLLVRELVALLFGRAPNHDYNSARRESPADSRHSFLGTIPGGNDAPDRNRRSAGTRLDR